VKDYTHNICPKCGGKKYYRSPMCWSCRNPNPKLSHHHKEPCPKCGRPKLVSSVICKACVSGTNVVLAEQRPVHRKPLPSPDWEKASHDFLVQFTGIFMGEGCISAKKTSVGTMHIRMAIKLRADDIECLKLIQSVLGGSLASRQRSGSSPQAEWTISNASDIRPLLEAMKSTVVIPMKKAREFDIALAYFKWRDSVEFHHLDRDMVDEFVSQLSAAKKFK
jgi:hypothetical protein